MFPNFKNDPNGISVLYFTEAGTVSFGASVDDGTTLSLPAGLASVAAYEADGTPVALSEFTWPIGSTVLAIDSTIAAGTAVDGTIVDGSYDSTDAGGLVASFDFVNNVPTLTGFVSAPGYDANDTLTFDFAGVSDCTAGTFTSTVTDVGGEVVLTWSDAGGASAFPVRFEYTAATAVAVTDSRDSQESQLAPVATQVAPTVNPTVGGDGTADATYDASADTNVPEDLAPQADEILVNGFTAPNGDANDVVPSDLPPTATKRWN